MPCTCGPTQAEPEIFAAELERALQWSWLWQDRWSEIARRCPWSIIVEMTRAAPVHYAGMLLQFVGVLDHVLSLLDEAGPRGVAAALDAGAADPVRHAVPRAARGPRAVRSGDRTCGSRTRPARPGELLADTVGLAELGLPDLQVVFTDRDPADVAKRLRRLARSIFVGERLDCGWVEESRSCRRCATR